MVECVATAVTETVVVAEVEAIVTVSVSMILDINWHVLLHVHRIRDWMSDWDLHRHLDRVRDWSVDVNGDVFLDMHGVWHWFLNGHRVWHVFLDRHNDWPVYYDGYFFGDVYGTYVSITVVGSQQTVVGQTVPFAMATVTVAQTPKTSFALFLFYWLFGGLFGFTAD